MTTAFNSERMRAVIERFGKFSIRRTSSCMEFEGFLNDIGASGKCCIEIGTFHGISTMILAQYFDSVVTISYGDRPDDISKRFEIWDFLKIKNIISYDVPNEERKAKLISRHPFDFAYLDGDHAKRTQTDFDLTKQCGRILFHEYWPLQPPVWDLVNSLPEKEVVKSKYDCFAYWEKGRG